MISTQVRRGRRIFRVGRGFQGRPGLVARRGEVLLALRYWSCVVVFSGRGSRKIFVVDGRRAAEGCLCGILSVRGPEVSRRSLEVTKGRVQAPTPNAPGARGIIDQFSHHCGSLNHELLGTGFQSSRLPHRWRVRCRRLPTTRPTPRDHQEPTCPRKKCAIWTRWRPVPVKNVNYPRAPSSRRSGLVGPHTTPTIVNYKYMTSTS